MELAKLKKNPLVRTILIAVMLAALHYCITYLSDLLDVNYEMVYFSAVALVLLYISIKDERFDREIEAVKTLSSLVWFLIRVPGAAIAIGFVMAIPVILAPNYLGLVVAFAIYAFLFRSMEKHNLFKHKS